MDALTWVSRQWTVWFPDESIPRIRVVILRAAPGRLARAILFVFVGRERAPRVVVKVGFTDEERKSLIGEFEALRIVRPILSTDLAETVPEALALANLPDRTAMATKMVPGRRLLLPHLDPPPPTTRPLLLRFFRRSFNWTQCLAESSSQGLQEADEGFLVELVDRFILANSFPGPVARLVRGFGRALGRARIRWTPTWQHGDLSVGNVLSHRRRLLLVDWEHSTGNSAPWFDVSYSPVSTLLLARRQGSVGSISAVAARVLDRAGRVGGALGGEIERAWAYPLPVAWAVTLTAMSVDLRQRHGGRGGEPWAAYAVASISDRSFRERIRWLAPHW